MPEKNNDEQRLNPQIRMVEVGQRKLKKIDFYPLSITDQLSLTNMIKDIVQRFVSLQDTVSDVELVVIVIDAIEKHIVHILTLVTDMTKADAKKLLSDITNTQITDMATVIWEVNYEGSVKNVQDLFGKARNLFDSKRSLQPSSNDTDNTISATSTEEDGKTEG